MNDVERRELSLRQNLAKRVIRLKNKSNSESLADLNSDMMLFGCRLFFVGDGDNRSLLLLKLFSQRRLPVEVQFVVDLAAAYVDGGKWHLTKNRFGSDNVVFDDANSLIQHMESLCGEA